MEEDVYKIVAEMRSLKAPATRASRFREALNFAKHTFGMVVEEEVFTSKRVQGARLASSKTKRMLVQREPLKVSLVVGLENLLFDEGVSAPTRVFICFVLLMVHTRARYADSMTISEEPVLDGDWLEAATSQYKQCNQPHRRNKWLYLVGPSLGVSGKPWASAWLQLRKEVGLVAAKNKPMMPAHGAGGKYTAAKQTLWEFTLWLRDILIGLGEDPASKSMAETGSHSRKAMSKAGMNKDDRKWLGGRLERNEASLAAYSRDMLSSREYAASRGDTCSS